MSTSRRRIVLVALFLLALLALALYLSDYEIRLVNEKGDPSDAILRIESDAPTSLLGAAEPAEDAEATAAAGLERPRSAVIFLADGMGFAQLVAARAALVGMEGRLTMERFPVTAWHTTHSPDGLYADSASGATAISTGEKTLPSYLGVDADEEPLETLFEKVMASGKSTALVTDSYLWDASPSAFYAHRPGRRDLDGIVQDLAASGVLFAGGEESPWGEVNLDPLRDAGYHLLEDAGGLAELPDGPVVVHLESGSIPDPERPPSLEELALAALGRVMDDPDGFVLFVETEETDSGAHNNDLDRVIAGLASLDRTVEAVLERLDDRDDVLFLVTADHETGGLALGDADPGEPLRAHWPSEHHTAGAVPLLAYGPGAAAFGGVLENDQVGRILRSLLVPPDAAPVMDRAEEGADATEGAAPVDAPAGEAPD